MGGLGEKVAIGLEERIVDYFRRVNCGLNQERKLRIELEEGIVDWVRRNVVDWIRIKIGD